MLAELTNKVTAAIERINVNHPGLDRSQTHKLEVMHALLEGVQHDSRELAKALLSACSVPTQVKATV